MRKGIIVFVILIFAVADAIAATHSNVSKRFNTVNSYGNIYPYVLNNTQINSNTKKTPSSAVARRAVVPRTNTVTTSQTPVSQPRRVVQRANTRAQVTTNNVRSNARAASTTPVRARSTVNTVRATTTNTTVTSERPSSQRCMADYKACMENYCLREDTAYNRCYCSARLAQIDSKYQNKIDDLIQQIVRLQYKTSATSEEIKEYWDQTVGVYTNDNPWVNIDNALNIEWADTQSRVRGQNAFNTGHQYCVQHLRACSYMASNMRDAYKSEIARDCETYEKGLQKIQDAAESVIESYHD